MSSVVERLTLSLASQLPQGYAAYTLLVHGKEHCGSGLARDGVGEDAVLLLGKGKLSQAERRYTHIFQAL